MFILKGYSQVYSFTNPNTFYIFDTIMKILNMQFSRDDIFTNILMNVIASTCMCEKV